MVPSPRLSASRMSSTVEKKCMCECGCTATVIISKCQARGKIWCCECWPAHATEEEKKPPSWWPEGLIRRAEPPGLTHMDEEHARAETQAFDVKKYQQQRIDALESELKEAKKFRSISLYDVLDQILLRPKMYFGRKSMLELGTFLFGLRWLGGTSHAGPMMFKLEDELFASGFDEWAREKHNQVGVGIPLAKVFVLAENAKDPTAGPYVIDARAFDLFVADLKEFRNEKAADQEVREERQEEPEALP